MYLLPHVSVASCICCTVCSGTEHIQQDKAKPSSSSQKTTLLEQLGLVASSVDSANSTPGSSGPSSGSEEKNDSQAEGEKREESEVEPGVDPFLPEERPPQKNKKKCWICKSKLELAQRELGTCKCGKLSLVRGLKHWRTCNCVGCTATTWCVWYNSSHNFIS